MPAWSCLSSAARTPGRPGARRGYSVSGQAAKGESDGGEGKRSMVRFNEGQVRAEVNDRLPRVEVEHDPPVGVPVPPLFECEYGGGPARFARRRHLLHVRPGDRLEADHDGHEGEEAAGPGVAGQDGVADDFAADPGEP